MTACKKTLHCRFFFITLPVFVDLISEMILYYLVELTALTLLSFSLAALTGRKK